MAEVTQLMEEEHEEERRRHEEERRRLGERTEQLQAEKVVVVV